MEQQRTQANNLNPATGWKRTIAFAIDMLIVIVLITLAIVFLNWALRIPVEYASPSVIGLQVEMDEYATRNFWKIVVIYSLAKLLVVMTYFAGQESSRAQATIGKRIFGLKVGDFEGKRISLRRAILRTFCKSISGQILLIGYLMAFFTKNKQALHDVLAGTFVFEK
ncbi:MAG: RDD family protein [Acidobacteriota bacterium]|nr:RDD family protein [Acidobacteriota bacterium]